MVGIMKNEKKLELKQNQEHGYYSIHPIPTEEEVTKFYEEEFYSSEYKRFNDSALEVQLDDVEFFEGGWKDIVIRLEKNFGKKINQLDVFDIGCGWGLALSYFKSLGSKCYGIDPAPEAIEFMKSKGISAEVAGFSNLNIFNKTFDFIMLNNVLEHLREPQKTLEDIYKLLNKVPSIKSKKKFKNDSLSPVAPFRILNIGNTKKIYLLNFINTLEKELGKKIKRNYMPMQKGDVHSTLSDSSLLKRVTGYNPKTNYKIGIKKFINWYLDYFK